jgi:acyl carrier protein
MSLQKDRVLKCIYEAVDEWNSKAKQNLQLKKSLDTVLMGENSNLDSLGIVNFIVSVEERIEDEFDKSILLADEKAMSSEESPFSSINNLSNYISSLLENISE